MSGRVRRREPKERRPGGNQGETRDSAGLHISLGSRQRGNSRLSPVCPPKLGVILLDRKDLEPAGAGETPIIAIAPAIANAVFDATGKRVYTMPMAARG